MDHQPPKTDRASGPHFAGRSLGSHSVSEGGLSGSSSAPTEIRWPSSFSGLRKRRLVLAALQKSGQFLMLVLAVILAYVMSEGWPRSLGPIHLTPLNLLPLLSRIPMAQEFRPFVPFLVVVPITFLFVFYSMKLYERDSTEIAPFASTLTIAKGSLIGSIALIPVSLLLVPAQVHSLDVLSFMYLMILVFFGALLFHSGSLIAMLILHSAGLGKVRVAIIATPAKAAALYDTLSAPGSEYALQGFVQVNALDSEEAARPITWLGEVDQLADIINDQNLGEVILAEDPGALLARQRAELAETCWHMGAELKMVAPFHPYFHTRGDPQLLGDISLLHVQRRGLYQSRTQFLKRAADLVMASLGLVALSPLLIFVALSIKIGSRGPVFFVQERVGLYGRRFRMFKFRSMRQDADDAAHREYLKQYIREGKAHAIDRGGRAVYKMADDPRITFFGRLIRKTSIDELPQLLNVVRGEMSLVGPRPPISYEVEEYESRHYRRLNIRPGITGLWQVSGRSRLTFEQMVNLDIEYIEGWSFWKDFWILIRTIPVVLNIGQTH